MITATSAFGRTAQRRSVRRTIVIVYWLFMLLFVVGVVRTEFRKSWRAMSIVMVFNCIFNGFGLLGGVRSGGMVKPFSGVRFAPILDGDSVQTIFHAPRSSQVFDPATNQLDEREQVLRDRSHFLAYTIARWMTMAVFFLWMGLTVARPAMAHRFGMVPLALVLVTLWSLPQSIILWTTEDAAPPE